MLQIPLEESLRQNGDAGAAEEVARLRTDSESFHRVMEMFRDMQMEHGTCQPRERRACAHCNAKDELKQLVAAYSGRRVVLA